jgi:hypothetical protein
MRDPEHPLYACALTTGIRNYAVLEEWHSTKLMASFVKTPTNAQGSSGFLLIRSKFFTPTCFGIWLPSSGGREWMISYSKNCLCYGRVRTMTRPVCPVVVECVKFHDNWPHGTVHSPHTLITQNIAWVAYQALTNPSGWQPYAETCRGRKKYLKRINKNPLLPWALVCLFTNDTTRCSIQPSRTVSCIYSKYLHIHSLVSINWLKAFAAK